MTHLLSALLILDGWAATPEMSPIALRDPVVRDAFMQGSLGPDIGYFPGGEPFITDLAHYVESTQLVRVLMLEAGNDIERAYALGWCSHVLLDARFHPKINEAAGALVLSDRSKALSYAEDPSAHVRVETGLDGWVVAKHASLRDVRIGGREELRGLAPFLRRAYARTYGIAPREQDFSRSLSAVVQTLPWIKRLSGSVACALSPQSCRTGDGAFRRCVLQPVGFLGRILPVNEQVTALAHWSAPYPWLLEELASSLGDLPRELDVATATQFLGYPDFNLDLGVSSDPAIEYPPATRTLKRLEDLRRASRSGNEEHRP